jgi:ribosomal protein S18
MSETKLIKQWEEKDLTRVRNIIEKRYGDSVSIQTGYTKQSQDHVEGDIWDENGKQFTIKNGIKQTITRFDSLKKYASFPLCCPECKEHFKLTDLNKKMFHIHGTCLNCVIKMETQLKIEGKYEAYEKEMMDRNKVSDLNELELALEEYEKSVGESFVTEEGKIESWQGGGVNKEYILKMKQQIKEQKEKLL